MDSHLFLHLRASAGDRAEAMLADARANAERLADEWSLPIDGWLPNATGSLVLTAGERVLRVPLRREDGALDALLALSGHGGVTVLAHDPTTGATLMPRIRPGHTLADVPEDEAVDAFADLVLRLRGAEGTGQPIGEYIRPTLDARPLPPTLRPDLAADLARLARRLVETAPPPAFLHGDLHHFNVLRDGETWVAIDPEGVVGDPAYECAAFLRNPVPELADSPDLPRLLHRRIVRLAERFGDPPERIWGWATVRTAQCVSWSDASPFHRPWTVVLDALDRLRSDFRR